MASFESLKMTRDIVVAWAGAAGQRQVVTGEELAKTFTTVARAVDDLFNEPSKS